MELMAGGTLKRYLQNHNQTVSYIERLQFAVALSSALLYLHCNGLVHRDVAARNCL